ncbi:MAG: response regulator [Myxococcota bacterium]
MNNHRIDLGLLIVEDDDAHAELVQLALDEGPLDGPIYRVQTAGAALQFLDDEMKQKALGCVLLDAKLSNRRRVAEKASVTARSMSGLDVLRAVRSHSSNEVRTLPVVMLTSSSHKDARRDAYEAGANSFVQKPIEFEAFQQTIQAIQRYWCTHNLRDV